MYVLRVCEKTVLWPYRAIQGLASLSVCVYVVNFSFVLLCENNGSIIKSVLYLF